MEFRVHIQLSCDTSFTMNVAMKYLATRRPSVFVAHMFPVVGIAMQECERITGIFAKTFYLGTKFMAEDARKVILLLKQLLADMMCGSAPFASDFHCLMHLVIFDGAKEACVGYCTCCCADAPHTLHQITYANANASDMVLLRTNWRIALDPPFLWTWLVYLRLAWASKQ